MSVERQAANHSAYDEVKSDGEAVAMQYQVFVQSQSEQSFVASIVGLPNLTGEGRTEAEAIANAKAALESQLATGKLVTIEVNSSEQPATPVNCLPQERAKRFVVWAKNHSIRTLPLSDEAISRERIYTRSA